VYVLAVDGGVGKGLPVVGVRLRGGDIAERARRWLVGGVGTQLVGGSVVDGLDGQGQQAGEDDLREFFDITRHRT
jgi:hypothetical protein